jgi:hypothetical protein
MKEGRKDRMRVKLYAPGIIWLGHIKELKYFIKSCTEARPAEKDRKQA